MPRINIEGIKTKFSGNLFVMPAKIPDKICRACNVGDPGAAQADPEILTAVHGVGEKHVGHQMRHVEQRIQIGAHGPRRLHVLLVDDGG